MSILGILAVLAFSAILSIIEIPKMLKSKLYKELLSFSLLLACGTILGVLKSLNINIPNPSDLVAWIYSPLSGAMKSFFK